MTNLPAAVGPYSHSREFGNLVFVSGQLPIDPETGTFNSDDPCEQMEQCLKNLAAVASAAGTDISKTLKTTLLVTDLSKFPQINDVYGRYFSEPYPARACFQVAALPKGAQVELEAVVAL